MSGLLRWLSFPLHQGFPILAAGQNPLVSFVKIQTLGPRLGEFWFSPLEQALKITLKKIPLMHSQLEGTMPTVAIRDGMRMDENRPGEKG